MRRLLLDFGIGAVRCALFEGDRLAELRLIRDGDADPVGAIHRARIRHVFKETHTALVDTVDGEAVLRLKGGAVPVEGALVTIEIVRAGSATATETKRPLAKRAMGFPEGDAVACLKAAADPLARFGADEVVVNDPAMGAAVAALYPDARIEIAPRWTDLFDAEGLLDAWAEAATGRVALPDGDLIVERTTALWSVDVNSGGSAEKVNAQAAARIGALLRQWNMGGLVVIDFASPARKDVLDALDAALAGDATKPQRTGLSPFGTVEIARTRSGKALPDLLTPDFLDADALLRAALREGLSPRPGGLDIALSPAAWRHVDSHPELLDQLAARTGRTVARRAAATSAVSLT